MAQAAHGEEYHFDSHLLVGSGFEEGVDLKKFNEKQLTIPEGQQLLDISLNGIKIKSQVAVNFRKKDAADKSAQPCINADMVKLLQLKSGREKAAESQCVFLSEITSQGNWNIRQSTLTLDFLIPQILLNRQPRDYIPTSEWAAGTPLLFS